MEKKRHKKGLFWQHLCTIVSLVCCSCAPQSGKAQSPDGSRYLSPVFQSIETTHGIAFSSATATGATSPSSLFLDFYEPAGDTLAARPLVITVFGGGFVSGSRDASDMVAYCERLAHHGYTAAAIDYRLLPLFSLSRKAFIREAYMASQDVSAAVRFFKANSSFYGIDTSRIFLLGNSAGSIAILHEMFLTEDERPPETFESPNLGPLHQSGSPSHFPYSPKVNAAILHWGGVIDLHIIDPEDYVPLCMIHGTNDNIVHYDSGYCFSSITSIMMPFMYGSHSIAHHLDTLGIQDYELHPFEGEGHCFYISGINTLVESKFNACFNITKAFLYQRMTSSPTAVPVREEPRITIYPTPAHDHLRVELPGAGIARVVLHDLFGRVVQTSVTAGETAVISVEGIPQGIYFLTVTDTDGRSIVRKVTVGR